MRENENGSMKQKSFPLKIEIICFRLIKIDILVLKEKKKAVIAIENELSTNLKDNFSEKMVEWLIIKFRSHTGIKNKIKWNKPK